ncbi:hypothetical protein PENTCL1PPCAC_4657, partial [Pristionchus entomophagus]
FQMNEAAVSDETPETRDCYTGFDEKFPPKTACQPPASDKSIASFITANAAKVGLQITGQALKDGYSVIANVEIGNYTKEIVHVSLCKVKHGVVDTAPKNIAPAENMKFSSRKADSGLFGCECGVWFEFGGRMIYIYWAVPLTFFGGSNKLGLGIGKKGRTFTGEMPKWFEMEKWELNEYDDEVEYVKVEDGEFAIRGIMDTTKRTTIKVDVVPLDKSQFAEKLKDYV